MSINILEHTREVMLHVAQRSRRLILFYSCGKDSIAMLDLASKHFDEVICVFMYFVPGLEHIERYFRVSETLYPNVKFMQLPHWNLTYILKKGLYCTAKPETKLLKLKDVNEAVRMKTGINWTMYGMKQADGMHRLIMLRGYQMQAISPGTRNVYPLSLWKSSDVLRYIRDNRLPAPINYGGGRSSGLSFDPKVFVWLRENYPGDLQKILTQFPEAGRILFEHDRNQLKI